MTPVADPAANPVANPAANPVSTPAIRVVILNYDGGQMTLDCLDSVLASDWPTDRLEIVLVDNGSLDDVAERVRSDPAYSRVRLLEPLANLGFAGGCNLGIALTGEHDYVALINNDATVDPKWLRAMVAAFEREPERRIGAVAAKMLFAERAHLVDVEVPDTARILSGDPRPLGVRVTGVRLDGERIDDRLDFDEGFYLPEPPAREYGEEIAHWSRAHGSLRIAERPGPPPARVALRLVSLAPRQATLRTGVDEISVDIGTEATWVELAIDPVAVDIVNNVGSELYRRGFAGDRGFQQVDTGQYDQPAEVFAWCGGAVLLAREYLDAVGVFDDRFFLYYEDTDLAWRGRLAGWSYLYEPGAVVRHHHASSSGVGSEVFRFHTERNRLLVLAKNAPWPLALRSGLGQIRRLLLSIGRQYVRRPLTARLPVRAEVRHHRRVTASYLALLPAMWRDRRRTRPVVDRRAVMAWEVDKWAR